MGQESMTEETHHENEVETTEPKRFATTPEEMQVVRINDNKEFVPRKQHARPRTSDVARIDVTSLSSEESEKKITELCKKIDGDWSCKACDYTSPKIANVKRHAERHIDGLSYNCNLCNKEFRLSNSLNVHKYSVHKN